MVGVGVIGKVNAEKFVITPQLANINTTTAIIIKINSQVNACGMRYSILDELRAKIFVFINSTVDLVLVNASHSFSNGGIHMTRTVLDFSIRPQDDYPGRL